MGNIIDWDEIPKANYDNSKKGENGQSKGGITYLKFEDNKRYRVRLISKPMNYHQYFKPIICRSPGCDENGTVIDPLMQMGFKPDSRYSIWIFDREDKNALKLMDFGIGLYRDIVEWKVGYNEDPGGMNGPDFQIKTEGIKRSRKYKVLALEKKPFTEEELQIIKTSDLRKKLEEIRKPHTPEEIRKMYEKAKAEGKLRTDSDDQEPAGQAQSQQRPSSPAPTPTPVAAATTAPAATPTPAPAPAAKPVTPSDDPLNW